MKKLFLYIAGGIIILFVIAVLFTIFTDLFFNIDTYKVRSEATKEKYSKMTTYINVEMMRCSLGETTAMDGNLTCHGRTADSVIAAAVIAKKEDLINPYDYDMKNSSVTIGGTNTSDSDVGYIRLSVSGENIIIKTCHTKPCATNTNQYSKTIAFQ